MASGMGTATIDFGSYPGTSQTFVTVTGITGIGGTSKVEAWIMGDDTSTSHTANDHRWIGNFMSLTCGSPTAGSGFNIYATAITKLTGTWSVRWVWSD